MKTVQTRWSRYLDGQHRQPHGLFGRLIGERMVRQHAPETAWSIDLLALQPDDRALEIGFGAGRGLALALERTPHGHITGVDLSATMIRVVAQRNRKARAGGRLSLVGGDVAALPFHTQAFDKILSIHTFYFWPEPDRLFGQIVSLLAAKGRCVITFATAQTVSPGVRRYWPLHQQAEELVDTLQRQPALQARLLAGPDSRQFNNVAIVIDKA